MRDELHARPATKIIGRDRPRAAHANSAEARTAFFGTCTRRESGRKLDNGKCANEENYGGHNAEPGGYQRASNQSSTLSMRATCQGVTAKFYLNSFSPTLSWISAQGTALRGNTLERKCLSFWWLSPCFPPQRVEHMGCNNVAAFSHATPRHVISGQRVFPFLASD